MRPEKKYRALPRILSTPVSELATFFKLTLFFGLIPFLEFDSFRAFSSPAEDGYFFARRTYRVPPRLLSNPFLELTFQRVDSIIIVDSIARVHYIMSLAVTDRGKPSSHSGNCTGYFPPLLSTPLSELTTFFKLIPL